jgi:mRNA-degrading endonuclease RelE of RelBE toxin-antitoxin system
MSSRRIRFAPHFTQDFKQLQKRYRRIGDDLRPVLDQLRRAETPGEQIQNVGYPVYKVRIKNSDAKRGKSGGYRAVYYLEMIDLVVMITIYSKSDQSDIPSETLRRIIEEYEAENPPNDD